MSNIVHEMAIEHAVLDVDKMTDEELILFVDSRAVSTRDSMTLGDYFDKAVDLIIAEWSEQVV